MGEIQKNKTMQCEGTYCIFISETVGEIQKHQTVQIYRKNCIFISAELNIFIFKTIGEIQKHQTVQIYGTCFIFISQYKTSKSVVQMNSPPPPQTHMCTSEQRYSTEHT